MNIDWKKILAVVLGLVLLAGVAYLVWWLKPEVKKSELDTSNWQLYRTEEYGFEFKYPGRVEVDVKPKMNIYLDGMRFQVVVWNPDVQKTHGCSDYYGDNTIISSEEVVISGKSFRKEVGHSVSGPYINDSMQYATKHGSDCVGALFAAAMPNPNYKGSDINGAVVTSAQLKEMPIILEKIVSTFKFFEPATSTMDTSGWELLKKQELSPAEFGLKSSNLQLFIYRSIKQTGATGAEAPLYDLDLAMKTNDSVLYQFSKTVNSDKFNGYGYKDARYFVDDGFKIQDIDQDGFSDIVFESQPTGGASSFKIYEHVISYKSGVFKDISSGELYKSEVDYFNWLFLNGENYGIMAMVADDPEGGKLKCHFCESLYDYKIYGWDKENDSFVVITTIKSKNRYSTGEDAIKEGLTSATSYLTQ